MGLWGLGNVGSEGNVVLGIDAILGSPMAGGGAAATRVSKRCRAAKLLGVFDSTDNVTDIARKKKLLTKPWFNLRRIYEVEE